jgi:hypothetical protein
MDIKADRSAEVTKSVQYTLQTPLNLVDTEPMMIVTFASNFIELKDVLVQLLSNIEGVEPEDPILTAVLIDNVSATVTMRC